MNQFRIFALAVVCAFVISGMLFGQSDTTMTITSEGYVGIGNTQPEQRLHVSGGLLLDNEGPGLDRLALRTNKLNAPGRYGILFANNLLAPFLGEGIGKQVFSFYSVWGAEREFDAEVQIHGKAANSWGKTLFLTHDGTDGWIKTDAGNLLLNPGNGNTNLGIGTDKPLDKLSVQGGFTLDGGGELLVMRMRQNDSLRWTFLSAPWIENDFRLRNEGHGDVIAIDRETSYVGIRTTDPKGTLDVNGSIYQRGSELHADYVFHEDYQLESIDEHAAFMWENSHLKGIPKACYDENGREIVEVGSHRKGIVEELEKAHIYIEQLHNRIKALEERLSRMEESK